MEFKTVDSTYITSAANAKALPMFEAPEVAFVGRSNSGKSSLLNAILLRRGLARKGRTPGLTQMANFFEVSLKVPGKTKKEKKVLIFADLPGYGYAENPQKNRMAWDDLMIAYFRRSKIRAILFLMDIRRDFDQDDLGLLRFLSKNCEIMLVLTKIDKVGKTEVEPRKTLIQKALKGHKIDCSQIFCVSSQKNLGFDELRQTILSFAE